MWAGGRGVLRTREVYRFPNGVHPENGHLVWDIASLVSHVKAGIEKAKAEYPDIQSLSIDTWGVDYVLIQGDKEVFPVYAYRDNRTEAVVPEVHEKVPFSELYSRTGCQFQPFNSIYQLCHPTYTLAMNYVHELDEKKFTHTLWEMCTECIVVFPGGVGVLPWMLCGTNSIGEATAEKMKEFRLDAQSYVC